MKMEEDYNSSFGFMELLGLQDFTPYMFDEMPQPTFITPPPPPPPPQPSSSAAAAAVNPNQNHKLMVEDSSQLDMLLNLPATPNSSSISSASSDAANEDQQANKAVNEEEEQQKTKKELKAKKTNQKKQREPRIAFMTKSEVDHLEDGYRWRKYGQKAVKNSPFPRSYYRCTSATCGVKKRVERSCSDPTTVVTTYEGQHTHQSPIMPRSNLAGLLPDSSISAAVGGGGFCGGGGATTTTTNTFSSSSIMPMQMMTFSHFQQQQQQQQHQEKFAHYNLLSPLNYGYVGCSRSSTTAFCNTTTTPNSVLLRDHGLLQDLVPAFMPKED